MEDAWTIDQHGNTCKCIPVDGDIHVCIWLMMQMIFYIKIGSRLEWGEWKVDCLATGNKDKETY